MTEDVSASTYSSVRSGLQARCGLRLEQRTESAEKDAMPSNVTEWQQEGQRQ